MSCNINFTSLRSYVKIRYRNINFHLQDLKFSALYVNRLPYTTMLMVSQELQFYENVLTIFSKARIPLKSAHSTPARCARNTRSIRKMPDNGITYREGDQRNPSNAKAHSIICTTYPHLLDANHGLSNERTPYRNTIGAFRRLMILFFASVLFYIRRYNFYLFI